MTWALARMPRRAASRFLRVAALAWGILTVGVTLPLVRGETGPDPSPGDRGATLRLTERAANFVAPVAALPGPNVALPAPASPDADAAPPETLDREALIQRVTERHPSLTAAVAAWRAAAARYPQQVSLDDPMLELMMAPETFSDSSGVQESWSAQVSQKLPWPGKRALRGAAAAAEARAANYEVGEVRLRLGQAAGVAYADYFAADRLLELSQQEQSLRGELLSTARVRYETSRVPQQDVLQATVALADARRKLVERTRALRVAQARINTLLLQDPGAPLPRTRDDVRVAEFPLDAELLVAQAIAARPELGAWAARNEAARAQWEFARREYYPDLDIFVRHDRMWIDPEQQNSIGLELNVPLRRQRRRGAVAEAGASAARARAEYQAQAAEVRFEVESAAARLAEARQVGDLYEREILPVAEQNVASARIGYETGAVNFLVLATAQSELIEFRQRRYEARAEEFRQLAELERAVGGPARSNVESVPAPVARP